MSDTATLPNRAKRGVGLSGVTAGNTALCTVGRTGNDLHYRGYDILDVAETCEFEEIAYLLVHGALPTRAELAAYKAKLRSLRGLPASLKQAQNCRVEFFNFVGGGQPRQIGQAFAHQAGDIPAAAQAGIGGDFVFLAAPHDGANPGR